MRAARVVADSVRAMNRNRLRTFFMMLGTFIGVGALMVILAIGRGTQAQALAPAMSTPNAAMPTRARRIICVYLS